MAIGYQLSTETRQRKVFQELKLMFNDMILMLQLKRKYKDCTSKRKLSSSHTDI